MKKLFSIFLIIALCALLSASAFADRAVVIRDGAELLTDTEVTELNTLAWQVCDEQSFQVVVVTVYSTGDKDIVSYADDLYDESGYLADGVLLLLDMGQREWYVSTAGRGIDALSDANIDELMDEVLYSLSDGDYYGGFREFITQCGEYVERYDNGEYVPDEDDYYVYEDDGSVSYDTDKSLSPLWLPGSILAGIISAFSATGVMKSKMNNVKAKDNAGDYVKRGSLNLTEQTDSFLYSTVSRTPKPKDDDRGHTGGGNFGGGVHMSGGGVSHGGHGGHF